MNICFAPSMFAGSLENLKIEGINIHMACKRNAPPLSCQKADPSLPYCSGRRHLCHWYSTQWGIWIEASLINDGVVVRPP